MKKYGISWNIINNHIKRKRSNLLAGQWFLEYFRTKPRNLNVFFES